MFKQARFSFYVDSDPHQTLRNLEALVPGVLVYSQGRPGLRRFRIREPSDYDAAVEVGFEVVSPLNCAYLAEAWMRQGGCTYNARPHNGGDRIMPYPVTVEGGQALVDRGRWCSGGKSRSTSSTWSPSISCEVSAGQPVDPGPRTSGPVDQGRPWEPC